MKKSLVLILTVFLLACNQHKYMTINNNQIKALEAFKGKPKFEQDSTNHSVLPYTGLGNPALKIPLTEMINKACDDFLNTAKHNPTEENFQNDIKVGLLRFNTFYLNLDTEDRERICYYFEELMDCVGLESSNGQLNEWMYGFDPKS